MTETPQAQTQVRVDWRGTAVGMLLLLLLLGGGVSWQARENARAAAAVEAQRAAADAAAEVRRHVGAPTLRKGKPVIVKGRKMATYIVSGAGAEDYNGTYVENGTYNGKPTYTNGSRWLWFGSSSWVLSTAVNDYTEYYIGTGTDLPATPWGGSLTPPTLPAPSSVSEGGATPVDGETDPYDWPWGNWWWDGPFFSSPTPIAPGLVTVSGTQYVVFCIPDDSTESFLLFDTSAHTWAYLSYDSAPFAAWDTVQSGCLIDAGDGEHVWVLSGGHLSSGNPQFVCSKHSLLTGARVSQQAVALESQYITNMIDMDGGTTARFCERSAGTLRYHSYTLGAASYTELFELAAGDWPGLPVGWSDSTIRHLLLRTSTADTYYLRHANRGVVPYRLTATAAERLGSLGEATGGSYDSAGEYQGDIIYSAPTDDWRAGVWRWDPGEQWTRRAGFGLTISGRHWLVSDTANGVLYIAGWLDSSSTRPYVALIQPETITATFLASASTVYTPTIADRISAGFLASGAQVFAPSIRSVDVITAGFLESTSRVYAPTIYGSADRTAGASTAGWTSIRVRVGPALS